MNVRVWVVMAMGLAGCLPTTSVREACQRVNQAMCHRAFECLSNTGFSESDCNANTTDCCTADECDKNVHSPTDVDSCVNETESEPCDGWIAWNANPAAGLIVPGICVGVADPS